MPSPQHIRRVILPGGARRVTTVIVEGTGAASGAGTLAGAGATIVEAVGAQAGTGTVLGLEFGAPVGTVAGAGVAAAIGSAIAEGVGAASGTGAAAAVPDLGADPYLDQTVLMIGPTGADASTTFTDESWKTRGNATVAGNAQVDTGTVKFSGTMQFDGTGDWLSFADSDDWRLAASNTDEFTIECWVRFALVGANTQVIVGQRPTSGTPIAFVLQKGTTDGLGFSACSDGSTFNINVAGGTVLLNTWHHVAVDKDSSNKYRLYLDGAMVGSQTPANGAIFNVALTLGIGARSGSGGDPMNGRIEDLRITKGKARYASDSGYTVPTERFPARVKLATGAATGTGTHAGGGAPVFIGDGAAAGTGTATALEFGVGDGVITGTGTQTGVGASIVEAVGAASGSGAAVSGWTPANIGTLLWLDASDSNNVTLTGTDVDQWDDLSLCGNHVTQATSGNKPDYTTSGSNQINGMNTITLDGTDDFLAKSTITGFSVDNTEAITALCVMRVRDINDRGFFDFSDTTSTNRTALFFSDLAIAGMTIRCGGTSGAIGKSFSDTTDPHLWSTVLRTNKRHIRLDGGTATTSTTTQSTFGYTNVRVGQLFGNIYPMLGDYAELIVFQGDDDGTRERCEGYLAHKWGLTGNLPSTHPYKSRRPTFDTAVFSGAMVKKNANQTAANYTTATVITWGNRIYDEGGWFNPSVSTSAFTVPAGVTKVRVGATIQVDATGTNDWTDLVIRKNGSLSYEGRASITSENGSTITVKSLQSGPIACSPGDTFEVYLQNESDTSVNLLQNRCQFWIEKVQDTLPAFSGAMVRKASDQIGANYTGTPVMSFDTEIYDEGDWFDTGVSNTVFTVPAGVRLVRVGGHVRVTNHGTVEWVQLLPRKNGISVWEGRPVDIGLAGVSNPQRCIASGPIVCSPGDTFDLTFGVSTDTSVDVSAAETNFWIEKVA